MSGFCTLKCPDITDTGCGWDDAFKMISEGKGTQFDPKCVEAFLEAVSEIEAVFDRYSA